MNQAPTCFMVLFLLSGCAAVPAIAPANAPATIAAPEVRVGDYWEYRVRDGYTGLPRGVHRYEVKGLDAQGITLAFSQDGVAGATQRLTRDWNGLEQPLTNMGNFRYDPPYPAYAFPLQPGKRWTTWIRAIDPTSGRSNRLRVEGRVLGWERVKVAAGEFDALKIRRVAYADSPEYFRTPEEIVETDWYAPAVRQVVRREGQSSYLDSSRGEDDSPLLVRNDWLISELTSYAAR
jgi:hypothetical protein